MREEQKATKHVREAGACVLLPGASPPPHCPCLTTCLNPSRYLVQGCLWGQLQGHWLHGAAPRQDVPETPLGMGEGLWGSGPASPFPRLPLSNHLSHTGSADPVLITLLTLSPSQHPHTTTHLVSWSPRRWLSLERLHQVCSLHSAHEYLRF